MTLNLAAPTTYFSPRKSKPLIEKPGHQRPEPAVQVLHLGWSFPDRYAILHCIESLLNLSHKLRVRGPTGPHSHRATSSFPKRDLVGRGPASAARTIRHVSCRLRVPKRPI